MKTYTITGEQLIAVSEVRMSPETLALLKSVSTTDAFHAGWAQAYYLFHQALTHNEADVPAPNPPLRQ